MTSTGWRTSQQQDTHLLTETEQVHQHLRGGFLIIQELITTSNVQVVGRCSAIVQLRSQNREGNQTQTNIKARVQVWRTLTTVRIKLARNVRDDTKFCAASKQYARVSPMRAPDLATACSTCNTSYVYPTSKSTESTTITQHTTSNRRASKATPMACKTTNRDLTTKSTPCLRSHHTCVNSPSAKQRWNMRSTTASKRGSISGAASPGASDS